MMTVAVMAVILELVAGTPAYNVGIMAKKKGTSAFERGMKDGADSCPCIQMAITGTSWDIRRDSSITRRNLIRTTSRDSVVQATETVTQMKQQSTVDD